MIGCLRTHMSASSQSLLSILKLRMNSSFITSGPGSKSFDTLAVLFDLILCLLEVTCCLLINFANSLDPEQDQQNVRPDQDPIRLTL